MAKAAETNLAARLPSLAFLLERPGGGMSVEKIVCAVQTLGADAVSGERCAAWRRRRKRQQREILLDENMPKA